MSDWLTRCRPAGKAGSGLIGLLGVDQLGKQVVV